MTYTDQQQQDTEEAYWTRVYELREDGNSHE